MNIWITATAKAKLMAFFKSVSVLSDDAMFSLPVFLVYICFLFFLCFYFCVLLCVVPCVRLNNK